MPEMIDLESACLNRSERLSNKPRQKYGLFAKLLLAVIGACEVANNPHIFLTREKKRIHELNINCFGTLNNYILIVFAENQVQNK